MNHDTELLRRYVQERSETAFGELVREHLNPVFSAALRETGGDAALAEDVSQAVFTELARKRPGSWPTPLWPAGFTLPSAAWRPIGVAPTTTDGGANKRPRV